MKRWGWLLLLLLVGCQTFGTSREPTAMLATVSSVQPTRMLQPTSTPVLAPSPTAVPCPTILPELQFKLPDDLSDPVFSRSILDFLNAGGDPRQVVADYGGMVKDLDNDNMLDILLISTGVLQAPKVFTCKNGEYVQIQIARNDDLLSEWTEITALKDINGNGLPEIVITERGCFAFRCGAVFIVEWDGTKFANLIRDDVQTDHPLDYAPLDEPQDVYLEDLDGDGTAEVIWTGGVPAELFGDYWLFYPKRLETHAYDWDGKYYSALPVTYSAPEYRFQAVQDGDRLAKAGQYQKALESYQLAIVSDELEWWTYDRWLYLMASGGFGPCANVAPCVPPKPDPNERKILSAYATFRIMLLQLATNHPREAEQTYADLLKNFPTDNPGYPLVEMATLFWNEYRGSHRYVKACAESVSYIVGHPEILKILSGQVNSQAINYESNPNESCPLQ